MMLDSTGDLSRLSRHQLEDRVRQLQLKLDAHSGLDDQMRLRDEFGLTSSEAKIFLVLRDGTPKSYTQIERVLWPYGGSPDSNSLKALTSKLRRKVGGRFKISSVYGDGYIMKAVG